MKRLIIALPAIALLLAISVTVPVYAAGTEVPIAPDVSPPGEIPDNQVFIVFKSASGFTIKIPEGWARKEVGATTTFNDKYNRIALTTGAADHPLDVAYAKSILVPEIEKNGRAVRIYKVLETNLKTGKAIRIIYDSNSEPNDVTNKQVRQENERFFYAKDGKLVTLDLSAPKGADNVDQWKLISSSFRWK